MANPTKNWDTIPVWGAWINIDNTPISGTVTFSLPRRVTRVDGRVIFPRGATISRQIGDSAQQDSAVRSAVRAAWRAADQAAAGAGFDGVAWDSWWDDILVPAAIFTKFPAVDDPDIVSDPENPWTVSVSEGLNGGGGRSYSITPLMTHLDLPIPGINLGLIEVPPGSPGVPDPFYAKGIPGGVAALDNAGRIPLDQIPEDLASSASWDGLGGKPAVIAAGVDAAAARAAIGAQPAGSYASAAQGTKADTAVQPDGLPTWGSIDGKPAVVAAGVDAEAARDAIGVPALSENVRNILRYGVKRGTTTSQTAAIQAALNSAPGETFTFPPGSYRLDTTLNVTSSNTLVFAPGARLYAGAAMSTLVNYDNGQPNADNFAADKGIIGSGTLDCNLLADNALLVSSVLRFPLEGLTIVDPVRRGIWTKPLGAEILARNIRIHNTGTTNSHKNITISTTDGSASIVATSGTFSAADVGFPIIAAGVRVGTIIQAVADATHATLSTNASATATGTATIITSVGIDAQMGDCHWDDVVIRDFTVGIWDRASNLWHKIHPWIGTTSQLTVRYPHSVAFWVGGDSKFVLPTADTYRYAYRTASTGGWARMRLSMARGTCNTGQLTNALSAAYPGVMLDLQDQGNVISVAGSWQGHNVTPHAFVAGNSKALIARDNLDTQAGSVASLGTYHRGVRLGTSSFSGTLFGTLGGSVTLTTNDCRMEVRDGYVRYVFIFSGTATADLSGSLRVGGLPLPPGAASVVNGTGTISFATGPDINVTIGGGGSAAPLTVQLHKMAGGTTAQPSATALAGQPVQIWGEITCPFVYPA